MLSLNDIPILTQSVEDNKSFEAYLNTTKKPNNKYGIHLTSNYFESQDQNETYLNEDPVSKKINEELNNLGIYSNKIRNYAINLVNQLLLNFDKKIAVTSTTEDELLIYWQNDDTFFNVLIDEDSDIELLFIPEKRENTKNMFFNISNNLTPEKIISAFNEMQRI